MSPKTNKLLACSAAALLLGGCGGGDPGPGPDRAAGSLHRTAWSLPAAPGLGCRTDIVVRISSRTSPPVSASVIVASDVTDAGHINIKIPDAPGMNARTHVERACDNTLLVIGLGYAIIASDEVSDYAWERVTKAAAFKPRDGAGALVFQDKMWLIGGWSPGAAGFPRVTSNEVWSSIDGDSWTLEKENSYDADFDAQQDGWEGRHSAGYFSLGARMLIAGGDITSGHYQSDVWSSPDGVSWQQEAGAPQLQRRLLFNSFTQLGRACIFGGQTIPAITDVELHHADLWCLQPMGAWQRIAERVEPLQRSGILGEAVLRDEVWILGGGNYEFPVPEDAVRRNDVWKSSDLQQWAKVTDHAPWPARIFHSVAAFDDRLWVMAGYDQGNLGDCWYSKDGYNWYVIEAPWSVRHAASVFVHRDALWLVAGADTQPLNDVWRLRRAR